MKCKECHAEVTSLANDLCIPCWNVATEKWQKRMAIRQDAGQFDPQRLVNLLLTQHWMHKCQIIPAYMPPFPRPDTRPRCVVRYIYDSGEDTFLRHSGGPLQGFFWDMYGDDLNSPELALIAISQAPPPHRVHACIPTHGR